MALSLMLLVGLFVLLNINANGVEADSPATESQEIKEGTNYTSVPIRSAFGWKLGDSFNDPGLREIIDNKGVRKKVPAYSITNDGYRSYWGVRPPQPFLHFNQYNLTVTPTTKKIAKIYATFCSKDQDVIDNMYKSLTKAMTQKYGKFTVKKNNDYEEILFIEKNNPKKKISIHMEKRNEYTVISMEYSDADLLLSEQKVDLNAI